MANFQQVAADFLAAHNVPPVPVAPEVVRLSLKQRFLVLRLGAQLPLPEAFATRDELNWFVTQWQRRYAEFARDNGGLVPMGGELALSPGLRWWVCGTGT